MKGLYFPVVACILLASQSLSAQDTPPPPNYFITIDEGSKEFSEFSITKKVNGGPSKVPITPDILKSGFIVNVREKLKVDSVRFKSKPNENAMEGQQDISVFLLTPDTSFSVEDSHQTSYVFRNLTHLEDKKTYLVIFFKNDSLDTNKKKVLKFKIYTLNVSENKKKEIINGPPKECTPCEVISLQADSECKEPVLTKVGNFGEDKDYYDRRKVVYVYDFNPDIHKRALFRVKRKGIFPKKYRLHTRIANLNRDKLYPHSQVEVKLVNVNKFLYDVEINATDVDLDSQPSFLFRELFLGDSAGLLGSVYNLFKAGFPETSKISAQSHQKMDTTFNRIECILKNINTLQAEALKAYSPCGSFPCCQTESLVKAYKKIADQIVMAKVEMSAIQNMVNGQKKKLSELKAKLKSCEDVNTDIASIKTTKESDQTQAQKDKLKELTGKKCDDSDIAKMKKDIPPLQEEVDAYSVITEINGRLPSEVALRKLIVFIEQMVRMNYTHVAGPFFPDGNLFDLEINIKTKDTIASYFGVPTTSNTIKGRIPVLFKGFVSFSSGTFLTYQHHLINKTYDWQQVPHSGQTISDTTSYRLVESGYSRRPMGFAAMGNMEWRIMRSVGIGASVGAGLTIERDPRIAYLAGGSVFLGSQRQFAITGGFAGMEVKTLTNNLKSVADAQLRFKAKPTEAIAYYQAFKIGGFVSITFTPFKSIARSPKSKSGDTAPKTTKEDSKTTVTK